MAGFELNETMYVSKSCLGVEDVARGFKQEIQQRAGAQTPITQINASHFRGVLTFPTLQELNDLNTEHLGANASAVVKETGQIYFYNGTSWVTSSNQPARVSTINDLAALNKDIGMAYVADLKRGGFFLFNKEFESKNDGGTIFNGWVRQFSGLCDVKWFGAVGDGRTDDSPSLQAAFDSHLPIELTKGVYFTSRGLTLKTGGYLCGNRSGTIKFEDEFVCLTLESDSVVKEVNFEGKRSLNSQVAISVNGGASYNLVSNTLTRGCSFNDIGGTAYKLEKVSSLANEFNENFIKNSKCGIDLSVNGEGAMIADCVVSYCDVGLQSQGFEAQIVNCKFLDNGVSFKLTGGNTTTKGIKVVNCSIQSSGSAALLCDGVNYANSVFLQTRISGVMSFVSSSKVRFIHCDLSNNNINFTESNFNEFSQCIVSGINVQNNDTCNYFTDSISTGDVLDAGFIEANLTNMNIAALQSQSICVKFNAVTQSLPFNPNFSKYKIYDPVTGLFDLTQVVSPNRKDFVFANIQVMTSSSSSTTSTRIYLYRVDNAEQEFSQTINYSDIVASLSADGSLALGSYGCYSFSGFIPRGKYRVCVRTSTSDTQILKSEQNFIGSGKTITRARFYGI